MKEGELKELSCSNSSGGRRHSYVDRINSDNNYALSQTIIQPNKLSNY
jgi:hypothetical protein